MSRVTPIKEVNDPDLKGLFDKAKNIMGFESVDALIMAHCPDMLRSTSGWITSILQKGNIDPGLKRLIGYICSTATGCQYCTAHTNYTARFYQIDEEKMKNVWNFESSDLFTPSEKAALQLAKASSEQPNGATEKDFDLLRQFYTKNEIVEIVFTISLYAFLNKFNSTMNTELEDAPRELLEKMIAQ